MWRILIAGHFYPPTPPRIFAALPPLMGQTGVKKIAVVEFLSDIPFIVAFIASGCIKRYWETISGQSK